MVEDKGTNKKLKGMEGIELLIKQNSIFNQLLCDLLFGKSGFEYPKSLDDSFEIDDEGFKYKLWLIKRDSKTIIRRLVGESNLFYKLGIDFQTMHPRYHLKELSYQRLSDHDMKFTFRVIDSYFGRRDLQNLFSRVAAKQ